MFKSFEYPYPEKQTIDDFIKKHHPFNGKQPWKGYCEICIDKEGNIYECIPSHSEFAINYAKKQFHLTREMLCSRIPIYCSPIHYFSERCELIFVWYHYMIVYPDYQKNKKTNEIIKKLINSKLLDRNICNSIDVSHEYSIAKMREEEEIL